MDSPEQEQEENQEKVEPDDTIWAELIWCLQELGHTETQVFCWSGKHVKFFSQTSSWSLGYKRYASASIQCCSGDCALFYKWKTWGWSNVTALSDTLKVSIRLQVVVGDISSRCAQRYYDANLMCSIEWGIRIQLNIPVWIWSLWRVVRYAITVNSRWVSQRILNRELYGPICLKEKLPYTVSLYTPL